MSNGRRAKSAGPLAQLYRYNRNISRTKERIFDILCKETNRGVALDKERSIRLENVRSRMTRLTFRRNDELMKIYSDPDAIKALRQASPKRPKSHRLKPLKVRITELDHRPPSAVPSMKVSNIAFNDDEVQIRMNIPLRNNAADENAESDDVDDDIVYPDGVVDRRPYQAVARYRRAKNESVDFKQKPLRVGADESETAVVGLDTFAENHHCELIFAKEDHRFDNSIYRAACGVADLGSVHLLAMDAMQTATFKFTMNFDFSDEFRQSKQRVETFTTNFCQSVANVVGCPANSVRLFSISKMEKEMKKCEVKFGITTEELTKTKRLADQLKTRAQAGFANDRTLGRVLPQEYNYSWESAVKYLRLDPNDFDHEYDLDYRDFPSSAEKRGSHPYYFPRGWCRLGLRVSNKYRQDQLWIGQVNGPGEWAVAFHGAKAEDALDTVRSGLRSDAFRSDPMRDVAVATLGKKVDRPGLYVYTKCEGGASLRSEPFTLNALPGHSERFRLVFQCRVKPVKYTVHPTQVEGVDTWRYVDANFIRPYGLLLKKETEE